MKERPKEVTHKIMASIKAKDTKPEIIFRKALWKQGIRYRKQVNIYGRPDLAIKRYKIAIFIDGDFWHGNNWKIRGYENLQKELETYSEFWREKIEKNIVRDCAVNEYLQADGWIVIRYWQSEIEKNLDSCIQRIISVINEKKSQESRSR